MDVTTLSDFRRNMKAYFDKVLQLRTPLFISRPRGEDMVLMSKEEYESMQETFYLLKSPKNAERLLAAIEADKKGEGLMHDIED
jgi:antitoxin YefM